MKRSLRNSLAIIFSVICSTLFVVAFVSAATTISTNIQTDGTLSVTGASTLTGNVTIGGTVTVPAAYSLDVASAGTLNLGTTTASLVQIGGTTAPTKVLGLLTVPAAYSLDTASAGVLNIGTTTATSVQIGGVNAITKILGNITVPPAYGLDVSSGGTLNIGTTTASSITIAKSGVTTTVAGPLSVTGALTQTGGLAGIGTTTPYAKLELYGVTPFLNLVDSGAAVNAKRWFVQSNSGSFTVGTTSDVLNATTTDITITNAGFLGTGTSTPAAELSVEPAGVNATSTLMIGTKQSTSNGSCIQMFAPNGSPYRLFVNNAGTLVTAAGACK